MNTPANNFGSSPSAIPASQAYGPLSSPVVNQPMATTVKPADGRMSEGDTIVIDRDELNTKKQRPINQADLLLMGS